MSKQQGLTEKQMATLKSKLLEDLKKVESVDANEIFS